MFNMNKIFCNNIHFGSKPLYQATLKKKDSILPTEISEDVYISELEETDKDRLADLKPKWEKTLYGPEIINKFLEECRQNKSSKFLYSKYFVIEDKKQDIKGLAHAKVEDGFIKLAHLQSEREIKGANTTQGVGSCLLYAVSRFAQDLKMKEVNINSIPQSVEFYFKAGIETTGATIFDFVIKKDDYIKFQKNIEEKYSIIPAK